MRQAARHSYPGGAYEGLAYWHGKAGRRHPVWTGKVLLLWDKMNEPRHWRKPRRVFVNSMSDCFHEDVPGEFLHALFDVMEDCPQHVFQVLTKRPERMAAFMQKRAQYHYHIKKMYTHPGVAVDQVVPGRDMLAERRYAADNPHIWMGTSTEDQRRLEERIPHLLETPAAVRFLSCEPLLGPLDLWPIINPHRSGVPYSPPAEPRLHWVIAGGESGPGWRPMDLEWARRIRDQCAAAGVAFFFKQSASFRPEQGRTLDGLYYEQFPDALPLRPGSPLSIEEEAHSLAAVL